MYEVLERGIVRCFPQNEFIQRMVRRELLNPKHFVEESKVDTLSFMTIKSIIHKELMTDETDLYSKTIYSIIFKEYISDWDDFHENKPIWKATTLYPQPTYISESECQSEFLNDWDDIIESEPIWKAATSDQLPAEYGTDRRKAQLYRLRFDGPIMFSIVSQHMYECYNGFARIILTRNVVQICFDWLYFAEIPYKNGMQFDTFWAEKFLKLVLSKYTRLVYLTMIGEGMFDSDYMANYLNKSIIDKIPRVIPPEGWKQYISEERPVYSRWDSATANGTNYEVQFSLIRHTCWSTFDESRCWGYIEKY